MVKIWLKSRCLEQVLLFGIVLSRQQQILIILFSFFTLIVFTSLTLSPTPFPPITQHITTLCIWIIFPLKREVSNIYWHNSRLHLKIILSSNSGYKILYFLFISFIYILNCLYFFCLLIDLLQYLHLYWNLVYFCLFK